MTERDKRLVKDYGPMFVARARIIMNQMLRISSDADSIFEDDEWAPCANAWFEFQKELVKATGIAEEKIENAVGEDWIDLYSKARDSVKRFI